MDAHEDEELIAEHQTFWGDTSCVETAATDSHEARGLEPSAQPRMEHEMRWTKTLAMIGLSTIWTGVAAGSERRFAYTYESAVLGPEQSSKVYGRLSVMVQQQAEGEILFHVGPSAFHPRPAVTSAVLRLRPRLTPLAPVRDPSQFAQVVKQGFAARRKMLRRALEPLAGAEAATRALALSGI